MKRPLLSRYWLALLLLIGGMAHAQVPAQYEGADRTQRLIEGARREGPLLLYTSMAERDTMMLTTAFEKKYGIKVNIWRSGKNKVLQRVVTEARAGRFEVDVVQNPSPEMEALHREKLLQPARSPYHKDLIPAALPAHREWTGMRLYVFVQAYNTQKVSRDELPRTWQDLLDPRWKGRLAMEAKEQEWFYTLVQSMGEEKGLQFFRELVAKNSPSVRTGNSLLANLIGSGEVPLSLTLYSYLAEQNKAKGAPIDYTVLKPTVAYTDGIGIARRSPRPNGAALFYDFMLSDGQKLVAQNHQLTTNRSDESKMARFEPIYIDPPRVLDTYEKWGKLYEDTLNGRGTH